MRGIRIPAAATLAFTLGTVVHAPAFAHELDEYVQSALISVEKDHLDLKMRLVPGVEVFPQVFANIDANQDGAVSKAEEQAYARNVLHDLTLSINGKRATPEIVSIQFPSVDLMKEGLGEIQLALRVPIAKSSARQKLVLENHHQRAISAYLVNCLKPQDPSLNIVSQRRSPDQSHYELEYESLPAGNPPFHH